MSPNRQLAAIMFTDIVGYTALMGKDSAKALNLVRQSKEIQKPLVEKHNGKWLKEMGDGAMASFNTALDAVNCALEIQRISRADFEADIRIGIHSGDITIEDEDIYGDGVNVASRLESIADPGGIYISDAIEKAIRGQLALQAQYLGEIKLKNVDYDVRTYALQGVGLPIPEVREEKKLRGHFMAEVQRRGVLRAGFAYIAVAFLVILLWNQFQSPFGLPEWSFSLLIGLFGIGFPIALFLAWNYERSPEGFVRTTSQKSWQNPYSSSQRKPLTSNFVIIGLIISIAAVYLFPLYVGNSNVEKNSGLDKIEDKSIAVIPFENLSTEEENQYFADGQMEAILNHLSKIADLRVISRTTMLGYRSTTKSIPIIANELKVRYILEGSVQKSGDKVRINAQLIDSQTDEHLWSNSYDRDLTDIFTIQSEIAKNVVDQLRIAITVKEQTSIEARPTTNLAAYDFYLKGTDYYWRSRQRHDIQISANMYQRSVELDPDFTLAWTGLARAYRQMYWYHYDRSEEIVNRAKQCLDNAIELDPDLLEVRLEMGSYYYHCKLDYQKALQILEPLKLEYPNNEVLNATIGFIYRRMGDYEVAFDYMDLAKDLNPDSWEIWDNAGQTLVILGRYEKARMYLTKAINLNPSEVSSYLSLARMYLNTGNTKKAREILNKDANIEHERLYLMRAITELNDRNFESAVGVLESSPFEVISSQYIYAPVTLELGLIDRMQGKTSSQVYFEAAIQRLKEDTVELPKDSRLYSSLGIAYAGLGMKDEALAANEKALSLMNTSIDAFRGYYREYDAARIFLLLGDYDQSVRKIEFLLDQTWLISVEYLKMDPFWDPLREMNAFKDLISNPKYQIQQANSSLSKRDKM